MPPLFFLQLDLDKFSDKINAVAKLELSEHDKENPKEMRIVFMYLLDILYSLSEQIALNEKTDDAFVKFFLTENQLLIKQIRDMFDQCGVGERIKGWY